MEIRLTIPLDMTSYDGRHRIRLALNLLDEERSSLTPRHGGVAVEIVSQPHEPDVSPRHPDVCAAPVQINWDAVHTAVEGPPEPLVLDEAAFLGEAAIKAPVDPDFADLPLPEPHGSAWIEHVAGSDHEDAPPIPMVGPAALAEAAREEAETPFDTIEHGPWTDANDEQLLIMARAGKPFESILDVLGRSRDDVEDRLGALAPEPRNATTIGAALAKVRARIALINAQAVTAAPPPPFWTPERDLQLAQGIIGSGLTKTIAAMGITKEEARARWNELLPRKGIAEQAKLVAKLKAAAGRAA